MSNTIDTWIVSPPLEAFFRDVSAEARAAQRLEPGAAGALDRCARSGRDLHWALAEHADGHVTAARVYANAVRLAASAARVALGGDGDRPYAFDMALHDAFAASTDLGAPVQPAATDARSAVETKW